MNDLILRAQNGDNDAMNEIINANVGLVWSIVKRFSNRGYEIDDLFQLGCMGFVKAIKRFDVSFETQLSTYAVSMIIGEIKRFIRDDGIIKVSRTLKEIATKVRELEREYREKNKELSIEEIAEILELDKEEIIIALDATSSVESLDKKISEDADSKTLGDSIQITSNEYEELLDKITINSLFDILDERERKVILYRYYKDMTQGKIAEEFGTSQVQVSRIEKKALMKMRNEIDK